MDPITTAIVAAIPAVASELVKSSIKDAYAGLKTVIGRKWGGPSGLATAVKELEADPTSKKKAASVEKIVASSTAANDREVMEAVAKLVDELKKEGIGGEAVGAIRIKIAGGTVQGVVSATNVSIGSMNFGTPPKSSNR
jgi:hypothetical protein